MKIARDKFIGRIAFPSISTGVYGYPVEEAAKIAVDAVMEFTKAYPDVFSLVEWVCFDVNTHEVYEKEIQKRLKK